MAWSQHPPLPLPLNLKLSSTLANEVAGATQSRRPVIPNAIASLSDWMINASVPRRRVGAEAHRHCPAKFVSLAPAAA